MNKVLKVGESFILGKCQCGCGADIPIKSKEGTIQRYKWGHINKGKKFTEEHKRKIGLGNSGEHNGMYNITGINHPQWKGNEVGYSGLHYWVRSQLPQPELCQICEKVPSIDLANMTGIYDRELKN